LEHQEPDTGFINWGSDFFKDSQLLIFPNPFSFGFRNLDLQLLARAPEGEISIWPCEAVCEAMEEIASPEIGRGFYIGVHNSRGVTWRGEGGNQERDLAAKYRTWAERLHFDYPYVGGVLEEIAESYEREAGWHDSREIISKRLRS
jgi:hypothetical protein